MTEPVFAVDREFMEKLQGRLETALPDMGFTKLSKDPEGIVIEGYYEGEVRLWVFQSHIEAEDDVPIIDRHKFRKAINEQDKDDPVVAFGVTLETVNDEARQWFFDHIESPEAKKLRKEMN